MYICIYMIINTCVSVFIRIICTFYFLVEGCLFDIAMTVLCGKSSNRCRLNNCEVITYIKCMQHHMST